MQIGPRATAYACLPDTNFDIYNPENRRRTEGPRVRIADRRASCRFTDYHTVAWSSSCGGSSEASREGADDQDAVLELSQGHALDGMPRTRSSKTLKSEKCIRLCRWSIRTYLRPAYRQQDGKKKGENRSLLCAV